MESHEDSSAQQQQKQQNPSKTNEFDYGVENEYDDNNDRDGKPGTGNIILEKIRTSSSDEYAKYFDTGKALYCEFKVSLIF